jgi:hypothetical protein
VTYTVPLAVDLRAAVFGLPENNSRKANERLEAVVALRLPAWGFGNNTLAQQKVDSRGQVPLTGDLLASRSANTGRSVGLRTVYALGAAALAVLTRMRVVAL